MSTKEILLFVYGAMMHGEPEHARLAEARSLGPAETEAAFDLVDLAPEPALLPGGTTSVRGELYALSPAALAAVDVYQGHPLRYRRSPIRLDDGRIAEAHLITADQARGKRRIRGGDFRARFAPRAVEDRAWSRYAQQRGKLPR
jgi:gamma-glutamylcyclotransferase (GGCT)/AIG2-like uncharacterized protein YtfP